MADDNDDFTTEHEGDTIVWVRLVCRGLEGGLRETVAANEPRCFRRGELVTLAVDVVVDHVAYPPHKPLDDDDEEEGVDRLHITKLATVAIVQRAGPVAKALDAQAERNAAARSEREQAREAKKAAKAAAALVDQCQRAGVAVFVKQDSGPRPGQQGRLPDELWALKEFPAVAV